MLLIPCAGLTSGLRNTRSNSARCRIRRLDGNVWRASSGKAYTAFGAAGRNDCSATFGFHAHQKSVGAFSFGDGRLVGTFHNNALRWSGVGVGKPAITMVSELYVKFILAVGLGNHPSHLWITFDLSCRMRWRFCAAIRKLCRIKLCGIPVFISLRAACHRNNSTPGLNPL